MVATQFKELRNVSADDLMFIKEDLIIPHHYSFYDFIVSKARGKSGPLFNFDVVEDVRLVSDAKKEKEDAHAGKVVERRWYERNRHIFPASRWVIFDPKKKVCPITPEFVTLADLCVAACIIVSLKGPVLTCIYIAPRVFALSSIPSF
jgi:XAP5, circadian clock regulator